MKPPKCRTCGIEEWDHGKLGCRAPGSPPVARHAPQPKPKAAAICQPKAMAAAPTVEPKAKPKKKRKCSRAYMRKQRADHRAKAALKKTPVADSGTPSGTTS